MDRKRDTNWQEHKKYTVRKTKQTGTNEEKEGRLSGKDLKYSNIHKEEGR